MKILHVLSLGAAMAVLSLALADPSIDAGQLGRMKGILEVCGRVDTRDASQYLLQMKALIGNATKQEVDQAAKTDEYQQAYQSIAAELNNMDPDSMAQACSGYLSASN